ncbi:MAG: hypothetical protein HZA91_19620, partial [Verrucomicrobia bacterium]|nr:hypothetical protein [Verrucomicrobiota bacterium]
MDTAPDTGAKREVIITCPSCKQLLDVSGLDSFTTVGCPTCGMKMFVPPPQDAAQAGAAEAKPRFKIVCSNCDQRLDVTELGPFTAVRCPSCGMKLVVPDVQPG